MVKKEILLSKGKRRHYYDTEKNKCLSCGSANTDAYVLYTCTTFDIIRIHCYECHYSWTITYHW
jgi:hypothetical protein